MSNETRRDFLRKAPERIAGATVAVGLPSLFAGIFGPPLWEKIQNDYNAESLDEESLHLKAEIIQRWGLKDIYINPNEVPESLGKYELTPVQSKFIEREALRGLKKYLAVYPPNFFREHVETITLAHIPPRGGQVQPRGFVASLQSKDIAIDLMSFFRSHAAVLGAVVPYRTTHHELGHLLVGLDEATLQKWVTLHPKAGYFWFLHVPRSDREKETPLGFADAYGQSNPFEDMATVYERMIMNPKELQELITERGDTVLQSKVEFIQKRLAEHDSRIDAEFWNALGLHEVDEAWWDNRIRRQANH